MTSWKEFKYKNITLVLVGLVLAFLLSDFPPFIALLSELQQHKYLGSLIGGFLFVSTFTFGIGAIILTALAENYPLPIIALFAGVGGVLGDLLILKFVRDNLLHEIEPLYRRFGGNTISKIFYSHFFAWTLPVLGAIIIASPLPDELGVTLLGISNIRISRFILISFVLDTVGVFLILAAHLALK
jgi:hypothetical protein